MAGASVQQAPPVVAAHLPIPTLLPLTSLIAPSAVAMCPLPLNPAALVTTHGDVITCFDAFVS
jgi:hypothetical protein